MLTDARKKQLAETAAGIYRRRCWWADYSDLCQTAHLAIVKASITFDPRVGVPEDLYAWKAILNSIQRQLWKDSSPVSGGGHRPRESYSGLRRTALPPEDMEAELGAAHGTCALGRSPERVASDREWQARVRERLEALSLPEIAAAMLEPSEVPAAAKKLNVSVREVRVAIDIVRSRVAVDPVMRDLLQLRQA